MNRNQYQNMNSMNSINMNNVNMGMNMNNMNNINNINTNMNNMNSTRIKQMQTNPMNGKNDPYNNKLLNGYNNFQMNNIPFKRNALLNNNPNFKQFISQYSPYDEKERFKNMHQQMNKLRSLQQIKQLEKYNDLDKFVDKDGLKESVIKPIRVLKPAPGKIINDYTIIKCNFDPDNRFLEKEYWSSRTNQPYKSILKNENYTKIPLKGAKKEDLIVHKVTDADKIGLMDEFQELVKILEKHNKELKVIYSTSKEAQYKAKFIYHNAAKYRIKYDPFDVE